MRARLCIVVVLAMLAVGVKGATWEQETQLNKANAYPGFIIEEDWALDVSRFGFTPEFGTLYCCGERYCGLYSMIGQLVITDLTEKKIVSTINITVPDFQDPAPPASAVICNGDSIILGKDEAYSSYKAGSTTPTWTTNLDARSIALSEIVGGYLVIGNSYSPSEVKQFSELFIVELSSGKVVSSRLMKGGIFTGTTLTGIFCDGMIVAASCQLATLNLLSPAAPLAGVPVVAITGTDAIPTVIGVTNSFVYLSLKTEFLAWNTAAKTIAWRLVAQGESILHLDAGMFFSSPNIVVFTSAEADTETFTLNVLNAVTGTVINDAVTLNKKESIVEVPVDGSGSQDDKLERRWQNGTFYEAHLYRDTLLLWTNLLYTVDMKSGQINVTNGFPFNQQGSIVAIDGNRALVPNYQGYTVWDQSLQNFLGRIENYPMDFPSLEPRGPNTFITLRGGYLRSVFIRGISTTEPKRSIAVAVGVSVALVVVLAVAAVLFFKRRAATKMEDYYEEVPDEAPTRQLPPKTASNLDKHDAIQENAV